MQGTSSCLWVFNLLLLRLQGEIFLSLLCSHNSWGSALILVPPLHVSCPQASVLHPDRRGLKSWLIRRLLLIQVWGTEGYCSHNWNVGWACSSRGVTLQQPGVSCVFSWGRCPWIMRPWQWQVAQALREWCVDSDLWLHTGFLVVAAAVLAFHAISGLWANSRGSRPSLKLI